MEPSYERLNVFRICHQPNCRFNADKNAPHFCRLTRALDLMKSILFGALTLFAAAVMADEPMKVPGIYSNMHFATEDVIGLEVFIVFGRNQYQAVVQCSEGSPGIPEVVPVTVSGSSISFKITSEKSGCPATNFSGQLTKSGLLGKFEGTAEYPGLLKRGRSYWQ